jgi:hypothetical protein
MVVPSSSVHEIVDRTQGVDDVLPYPAPRDFPLCRSRRSGSVRAAVDALAPHWPTTCCTSPHHEDDDDDDSRSTLSQGGPCAPISAPHGGAKDRLENLRSRRALERSLRTELSFPLERRYCAVCFYAVHTPTAEKVRVVISSDVMEDSV